MVTKKKRKLKEKPIKALKILGIVLAILIVLFFIYRSNINSLKELGYSEKASNSILFKFKKGEVMLIGKNKTLNEAFESKDYIEKNFTSYSKIKYYKNDSLIKNINELIKVGYANDEISMILGRGTGEEISEFAKKGKVKYLEEFYNYKFAKLSYYDRYVKYMDETGEDEETTIVYVNSDLDKENYKDPNKVEGFSFDMLVNKHNSLDSKFVPSDLTLVKDNYAGDKGIKGNRTALAKAYKMMDDAKKEGYKLVINSGYRSYKDQEELVNTYRGLYGDSYIEKFVLLPGFSEHQTGLGFDFGSTDSKIFAQSDEYKWMEENCYDYGFIHRFKTSYEDITGIKSETWHYRYVGEKIAKYIGSHDMSLEEYYARFRK